MQGILHKDLAVKLTSYKNNIYTVQDYLEALEQIGVKKGDTICVHSQIFNFGYPMCDKQMLLDYFCKILIESVGETGTLLMPAFSYSFCKKEDYNVQESPSTVGILTEYFRNMNGVKRTGHPIFSFSVCGKRAGEFLQCGLDAFDYTNSVYGLLIQTDDSIVMFGAPKGYTLYYVAEQEVRVSYRYFKEFSGNIVDNVNKDKVSVPYYVRCLDKKSAEDEKTVDGFLLRNNLLQVQKIGGGTIRRGNCRNIVDACIGKIREQEDYFLKY